MRTAVGVFSSRISAEHAVERLRTLGIPDNHIRLLIPRASQEQLYEVPTTDTERPGVGKAWGGVLGAIVGIAAANLLLPGVGAITTLGLVATVLCGIVGAVAGVAVGGIVSHALTEGLPKDELFVYRDALRQGRTVVVVLTKGRPQTKAAHDALTQAGAESIDAARHKWWLGLRDVEAETYTAPGQNFLPDEPVYRRGYERGKLHGEDVEAR